jgi:hypothetical protein
LFIKKEVAIHVKNYRAGSFRSKGVGNGR